MSEYIGTVDSKITAEVKLVNIYEFDSYRFSYYGTTNYIYTMEDQAGNVLVWKSTAIMGIDEVVNGHDRFYCMKKGDVITITGKVKEHKEYKGTKQTVLTRCKYSLISKSLSKYERDQLKREEQILSLKPGDFIWDMPYSQFKAHYADCETVAGSFDRHDSEHDTGVATIQVIIREGRLKNSGVRGKHFHGYEFKWKRTGGKCCFRAVSLENAWKQLAKSFDNPDEWEFISENRIYR